MMNSIRLAVVMFFISSICLADETSEDTASVLPPDATPRAIHMLRRTNPKKFQHFYSITPKEIKNLTSPQSVDPDGSYAYVKNVGYGSSKPGEGLVKVNRVILNNFATFYIKAPDKLNPRAIVHPFPVWVWKSKQPGLVPVYACSGKAWRNVVFSTDKDEISRIMKSTYNLNRVRPKYHGIVFYVIPPDSEDAKKRDESPFFDPSDNE